MNEKDKNSIKNKRRRAERAALHASLWGIFGLLCISLFLLLTILGLIFDFHLSGQWAGIFLLGFFVGMVGFYIGSMKSGR
jgi:drug/metabolite transporter (DMT)-like permease